MHISNNRRNGPEHGDDSVSILNDVCGAPSRHNPGEGVKHNCAKCKPPLPYTFEHMRKPGASLGSNYRRGHFWRAPNLEIKVNTTNNNEPQR
ncbi:type I restriction-modification protein subunit M [Anopheles sinensis]|uniref:Type I restriction-modification protein subunit M n=1 Tax=Anopheles sinensis TaxID=74873 RepID=A0A084W399_ANOSI|nr:type I restriction-modification protein subunit M [Anopheles sinensis]